MKTNPNINLCVWTIIHNSNCNVVGSCTGNSGRFLRENQRRTLSATYYIKRTFSMWRSADKTNNPWIPAHRSPTELFKWSQQPRSWIETIDLGHWTDNGAQNSARFKEVRPTPLAEAARRRNRYFLFDRETTAPAYYDDCCVITH